MRYAPTVLGLVVSIAGCVGGPPRVREQPALRLAFVETRGEGGAVPWLSGGVVLDPASSDFAHEHYVVGEAQETYSCESFARLRATLRGEGDDISVDGAPVVFELEARCIGGSSRFEVAVPDLGSGTLAPFRGHWMTLTLDFADDGATDRVRESDGAEVDAVGTLVFRFLVAPEFRVTRPEIISFQPVRDPLGWNGTFPIDIAGAYVDSA